jgi:hydroxyacylglutathione hydrolase
MTLVASNNNLSILRIETSSFGTNAYILICHKSLNSVIIDAPGEEKKILAALKRTKPKCLLITHSHMDHTGALVALKASLDIPVAGHTEDAHRLPLPPDILLADGETLVFGRAQLRVLHTPGHTPGSLCFYTEPYLLSGDTLFPGGPGKTATPTAFAQVVESIKEKIFVLPDDVWVFPGHGEPTKLKKEKEEFAVFSSRPQPPDLCGDILWLSS